MENTKVDFLNHGSGGTGIITGNVWRDLNADGVQDPGTDTGVAGWTVFLDLNGDQILDPDELFELTDEAGNYTFTDILGGGAESNPSTRFVSIARDDRRGAI
jgi:hypothetical protein